MSNLAEAMRKLTILADGAKYDVSCSSSGAQRSNGGKRGSAAMEGICHSWSADGRCISLLKILFTNNCVYDCEYCVNRRSAEAERVSFTPEELAELTMEFYRRNYIEGLFLSSAVEVSPDHTAERIRQALSLLRNRYGFYGYIHAKIIPGVSPELVHQIGMLADRLSVNVEMPTRESLKLLAPQKRPEGIFAPMKQITGTMLEQKTLKGAGNRFSKLRYKDGDGAAGNIAGSGSGAGAGRVGKSSGAGLGGSGIQGSGGRVGARPGSPSSDGASPNSSSPEAAARLRADRFQSGNLSYLSPHPEVLLDGNRTLGEGGLLDAAGLPLAVREADGRKGIYKAFYMKRVYFSAYVPVVQSPLLPTVFSAPPLTREHRLYQADWLMRFYGFTAGEILDEKNPNFDLEVDPKVDWALRNMQMFPIEINKASMEEILRIPGVGNISAARIVRQRRVSAVKFEDLKKMGVVVKRAKYFLTCNGKYYGNYTLAPEQLRSQLATPVFNALTSTGSSAVAMPSMSVPNLINGIQKGTLSAEAIRRSLLPIDDEVQLSWFSGFGASQKLPEGKEGKLNGLPV